MSKYTMTIGTDLRGRPFTLPADAVTSKMVAFGGSGMGKTNLGSVIIEELSRRGDRWAWMDPIGVSWGMRHHADGKGKGVQCLILGGAHGDIPIDPNGGAAAADVVVHEHANVLIDFSRKPNGEMWSQAEKTRFCTAYFRNLFRQQGQLVKGHRRDPIFQAVDEAARYVPQIIPHGNPEVAACAGVIEQAVEEGRNIGLGIGLWTLRSARLNKAVSELADVMFAFRTVGPNSLDAIMDWLGQHAEKSRVKVLAEQIRSLDRGTCMVVSPGWLQREEIVKVRLRTTFDSSATPKAGQKQRRVRGPGAKPDLTAIKQRMAAVIEEAKKDDPKALRTELGTVEAKLARANAEIGQLKAKKTPKPVTKTKIVKVPILKDSQIKKLGKVYEDVHIETTRHEKEMTAIYKKFGELAGVMSRGVVAVAEGQTKALKTLTDDRITRTGGGDADVSAFDVMTAIQKARVIGPTIPKVKGPQSLPSPVPAQTIASQKRALGMVDDASTTLGKGERAVLTAIAQNAEQGCDGPQLAVLTGYKETSRRTYLQVLSQRGFIRSAGGTAFITEDGIHALGDFETLPTGAALREWWLQRLGSGEEKILRLLAANPTMTKADIMDKTGYKETSIRTYLQTLGARKLVDRAGDDFKISPNLND